MMMMTMMMVMMMMRMMMRMMRMMVMRLLWLGTHEGTKNDNVTRVLHLATRGPPEGPRALNAQAFPNGGRATLPAGVPIPTGSHQRFGGHPESPALAVGVGYQLVGV